MSKWFDAGRLRGFKIPGSRERRIPRESLIRFMRAHGIPLRGLDGAVTRVLIVTCEYEPADALRVALEHGFDYEVRGGHGHLRGGPARTPDPPARHPARLHAAGPEPERDAPGPAELPRTRGDPGRGRRAQPFGGAGARPPERGLRCLPRQTVQSGDDGSRHWRKPRTSSCEKTASRCELGAASRPFFVARGGGALGTPTTSAQPTQGGSSTSGAAQWRARSTATPFSRRACEARFSAPRAAPPAPCLASASWAAA